MLRGAKRRSEYGSPPSPVPRRSRRSCEDDEVLSPHGKKSHKLDLPDDFMVTDECYDARPQGGRKLFKTVQPTQWSREWGLAGKRIEEITLPQLSWLGWENWGLRSLSAGSYTSLVFARSIREGQFLDQLQRELRSRHVDVESAAIQWAEHSNVLSSTSSRASGLSREDKNEAISKFVDWIADQVQKWSVSAVEGSQQARIKDLERQLREMREKQNSNSQEQDAGATRKRLSDKQPAQQDKPLSVDELFSNSSPSKKPLKADCPSKAGTSSVTAWLKKLAKRTQEKALADFKGIEPMMKAWDDDKLGSLPDIAAACTATMFSYAPAYGSSALTSLGLFFAGVFFLLVLFHSKKIVRPLQVWKDRFMHCGVTPGAYTAGVFSRLCVVYVSIPLLAVTRKGLVSSTCQTKASSSKVAKSMFYVGSTAISLAGRDAGRHRRYKQLYGTSAVQAETAVRSWF